MDLINGQESVLFCRGNRLNNASRDGMNGWIRASKKLSGQEVKTKNYCNWHVFFQVSGVPSLHLLVAHPLNAMKDMRNYSIWLKERV
jgi:hypothetical protein